MREIGSSTGAISDYSFSPAVELSHLAVALAYLGFSDQAMVRVGEAIGLARGTPLEAGCRVNAVIAYYSLRNWELPGSIRKPPSGSRWKTGCWAWWGLPNASTVWRLTDIEGCRPGPALVLK